MPPDAVSGRKSLEIQERQLLLVEGKDEVNLFGRLIKDCLGVFIVPDSSRTGAIETLCRRSVDGEAAAVCVEEYLECLKTRDALRSSNPDKTFAHAYLAAMEDPVARVGEGALQGVWNFQSTAFDALSQFVRDLAAKGDAG